MDTATFDAQPSFGEKLDGARVDRMFLTQDAGGKCVCTSSSRIGTTAWMMIGPVSTPPSTKWTVQPEKRAP